MSKTRLAFYSSNFTRVTQTGVFYSEISRTSYSRPRKNCFCNFFCTENVVHRRSRSTVFALLKLKNSPGVENPLNQNTVEMSQLFALLFAPFFGSSQRKS